MRLRPPCELTLEQPVKREDKGLGGLVSRMVVNLRGAPIKECVHIGRFTHHQRLVRRELAKRFHDDPLIKTVDVRLERARQHVSIGHCHVHNREKRPERASRRTRFPRRDALWAIKALRDKQLPLFAAADASENGFVQEIVERPMRLKPMKEGREVIEDYGHVDLSLRQHPVAFLRSSSPPARWFPAVRSMASGKAAMFGSLGSAKCVMFITIDDETGIANLIVWPRMFEENRRLVMGARLLGIYGQVQREGEAVHVIVKELVNLSDILDTLTQRDERWRTRSAGGEGEGAGAFANASISAVSLMTSPMRCAVRACSSFLAICRSLRAFRS